MVENNYFYGLNSVKMPQNVSFVFQVRNPFVRRSIKILISAKGSRFPCLPRGNGFITTAAIWLQRKEILKEKKSYGHPENGRNHESPGRNNVLFAEMKFSPAQMEFSPVQMTYAPVQMKFSPAQMTFAPVGGD